jgi:cytoskeletal protein CcmA (bactofilin family)
VANIGKSIIIKGDLSGDEDLVIDGRVEGRVSLPNNQVTIGGDGKITAEIEAKSIIVIGKTAGDLNASERVEIQATGVVDGDIRSPRLLIQEGAVVNGTIDMSKAVSPAAGKRETSGGAPRPTETTTAGANAAGANAAGANVGEPDRKSA